jgi:TetR/AcrR family transcriptional regulator, regulator of autoinduction and epiphytic fitness
VALLQTVLIDSAHWCLANPAQAKLALAPSERPTLVLPPHRPSFQGLVRDILVLGQKQGRRRKYEAAEFMALVMLGVFGQLMLSALHMGEVPAIDVRKIVRLMVEGIGNSVSPKPQ